MWWNSCLEPVQRTLSDGTTVTDQVMTIQCVPVLMNILIGAGLMFAGAVSALFIIRAGYQYIMSNGDPKQAGAARLTLTYAIIGLVVVFSSFFFLNIISRVTNTDCITKIGFSSCK